jgi:hypothetical protein
MKKVFYFIALLLSLIGCSKSNPEYLPESLDEKYIFPTQDWSKFSTYEQMLEACEIPDNILKALTTKALVETCMDYPLFFNFISYNYYNIGITVLINNFNGLVELSKRADSPSKLIEIYSKMSVPTVSDWTGSSMNYAFHISYLEMVISANTFLNTFSKDELTDIKPLIITKIVERMVDHEHFSIFSYMEATHLYARILRKQNDPIYQECQTLVDSVADVCSPDPAVINIYIQFLELLYNLDVIKI